MQRRRAVEIRVAGQPSPLGRLGVVEGPAGVLAVCFGSRATGDALERVAATLDQPINVVAVPRVPACHQLDEYFRGERRSFDVPLDFALVAAGFRRRALELLCEVPFGELVTYGELARRAGKPGAARAVGAVMRDNPIPILAPCHRVVAADGSLGGFAVGLDAKRRLHAIEGVAPLAGGWAPARRVPATLPS